MSTQIITTAQYLSFELDDEVFAIDITKVREVLEFASVTKVPQTPDFMRGVINLRGSVVPVVDLKQKFGISKTEKTINTCVIITEVQLAADSVILGLMADSVDEVFSLDSDQIEPAPMIGTHRNAAFLEGMGKRTEGFVMLLNIDKVFSLDEPAIASSSTGSHADESMELDLD